MAHVLEFALRGLEGADLKVVHTVAAFRMPASHDTSAALLVWGAPRQTKRKVLETLKRQAGEPEFVKFADEAALDKTLADLEDRGLLGWDRRANRYDLHPIVRGVVWSGLDDGDRRSTYEALERHFHLLPAVDRKMLTAWKTLRAPLSFTIPDRPGALRRRLSTLLRCAWKDHALPPERQPPRVELLEMLFPDGLDQLPRLSEPATNPSRLTLLAQGYLFSGQPGRAVPLYRMCITIRDRNITERTSPSACATFPTRSGPPARCANRRFPRGGTIHQPGVEETRSTRLAAFTVGADAGSAGRWRRGKSLLAEVFAHFMARGEKGKVS